MSVVLREDLLNPVAGANPAGESLRYAPLYDKIKEARREEDDAPQGDWQHERKTADFNLVIKLAGDAIAEKSKDLQLAAWYTEALLRKDGFNGLHRGLALILGLVESFWDGLYPEIEDGDLELRAAPLDWVGSYLEPLLKKAPFTESGLGYFKFQESRIVGYEEQASENSTKRGIFDAAKQDGKISADEFDAAIKNTPTDSYEAWMRDLDGSLETLERLDTICAEKFNGNAPSFSKLRTALEEIRNVVKGIWNRRKEQEAPPRPPEIEPEPEPEPPASPVAPPSRPSVTSARVVSIVPADPSEIPQRLAAVAKYLRQNDAYDPAPYLMLRGYRWGETRRQGSTPRSAFLVGPTTETRQTIRRLASESNWGELIEAGEAAMAEPCGRVWMDLQRYVVKALEEWGCPDISTAIRSELRALLGDIPEIPTWTFDDDTPVANGETQAWLSQIAVPPETPRPEPPTPTPGAEREAPPDTYAIAMQKVRSGRVDDAIEMLAQDISLQQSGRSRFQSKIQFAQLCLATSREHLALPILEELVETIDHHLLDSWEPPESIAHALTLLYRCLEKTNGDPAQKQKIYARICRLDPMQALIFSK